jgi:hypothetical protein
MKPRSTAGWIRLTSWLVGVLVAAGQAWVYRRWVNGDAISYFDMSDGVVTGHLDRLVNATWSPLYPALLGGLNRLLRPTPAWEFPVAHLGNLICFLLAFASFEFLLRAVVHRAAEPGRDPALPEWAILTVGYALFLWGALGMLTLMKPTPDMLMSAFLFLALGLLVGLLGGKGGPGRAVLFGLVLGAGYLAKAIMFPLGLLLLGASLFCQGGLRRALPRTILAVAGFAVIALPFARAVSRVAHRSTIGEAGTVVHLLYVDRAAAYWQDPGQARGTFLHPPRALGGHPPAVSFARPIAVTYPLWFDPFYWTEGVRPGFSLRRQVGMLYANALLYGRLALELIGVLASLLVLGHAGGRRGSLAALLDLWPLWLAGAAALGAYALLHVEERYVGAMIAAIGVAAVGGLRLPAGIRDRALRLAVLLIVLNLGGHAVVHLVRDWQDNVPKLTVGDEAAAEALLATGLRAGDQVARINPRVEDGWARLARVSIIAEVYKRSAEEFWSASEADQRAILQSFRDVGAVAVIGLVGSRQLLPGWQRLGTSEYAVLRL